MFFPPYGLFQTFLLRSCPRSSSACLTAPAHSSAERVDPAQEHIYVVHPAAMAACVSTCQWKFMSHDGATMAAVGSAALRPSPSNKVKRGVPCSPAATLHGSSHTPDLGSSSTILGIAHACTSQRPSEKQLTRLAIVLGVIGDRWSPVGTGRDPTSRHRSSGHRGSGLLSM